jgi:hypothetical protein
VFGAYREAEKACWLFLAQLENDRAIRTLYQNEFFARYIVRTTLVGCMIYWGMYWPRTVGKMVQYSHVYHEKSYEYDLINGRLPAHRI